MIEDQVNKFYNGLAERNGEAMVSCYHADVVFEDPAFGELQAADAGAMWRMLCSSDTDLKLTHKILEVGEDTATVNWLADYTFTATANKVHNDVTAKLRFVDGLIIDHRDDFSFRSWSAQALGLPGKLFGWTPMLKSKVQSTARASLAEFRAAE